MNAAVQLARWADDAPDRQAVVLADKRGAYRAITYAGLLQRTKELAFGFQTLFEPGDRIVMMVPPDRGLFEVGFALMSAGLVPTLIDPGMGKASLRQCLAESDAAGFVGVAEAVIAGRVLGWTRNIPTVVCVDRSVPGTIAMKSFPAGASEPHDVGVDDLAAIAFTSGSTGVPKGVEYTHGMFAAQAAMITDMFGIPAGETNVSTFAPFALLGPLLGMTTVLPHMDFSKPGSVDPQRVIDAVTDSQATMMFGSPALLDVVGRYGSANDIKLPRLRAVLSAGAPVRPDIQQRMLTMLSDACEIHTPYGATEALPVASIGSKELGELDELGICVGRPVPGVAVTLTEITDDPIFEVRPVAQGHVGEVVVSGPNVSRAYHGRDQANTLAKVGDAHRMGDLAAFDSQGRLWFYGRKSHRVTTGAGDIYTIEVESRINRHPAVRRSALVGIAAEGEIQGMICLELEEGIGGEVVDEIVALDERLVAGFVHKGFPTDVRHNSKIDRPALAEWATKQMKKRS